MISVVSLSSLMLLIYWGITFSRKKQKSILLSLCMTILFMPKINLVSVSSLSTAGIRVDDFLVFLALILAIRDRSIFTSPIRKAISVLVLLSAANMMSMVMGVLMGYNNQILYSILVIIRRIEYFSLILSGYYIAKSTANIRKLFFREYTILNIGLAFVSVLQVFRMCGYAVSGSESEDFFNGMAVSTFNGYYEYGQFLAISAIFYLIFYLSDQKQERRTVSSIMLMLSVVLLYLTFSRTALISFLITAMLVIVRNTHRHISRRLFYVWALIITLFFAWGILSIGGSTSISSVGRFSSINIMDMISSFWDSLTSGNFEQYKDMVSRGVRITTMISSEGDLSTDIRFFKWGAVLNGFTQYPLFGYGYGVTHVMDGNYFRLLGETGLIGTILWFKLYFGFGGYFKYKIKRDIMCHINYLIIISIAISATFIDMFDASKVMELLWLFVGLSVYSAENESSMDSKEQ